MSEQIFSSNDPYKFFRVEDYFANYKKWSKLTEATSHSLEQNTKTLTLNFTLTDGGSCSMLIHFFQKNTFRLRFNPGKTASAYHAANTRAVVQDTVDDLRDLLENRETFQVEENQAGDGVIELVTRDQNGNPFMKMVVTYRPFGIEVYNCSKGDEFAVWQTAEPCIYYTPHGEDNYAVIQAVRKPGNAKYIGFGEQGGQEISKNTAQLNYFNFDNMRYRQVYNYGPLDSREPLYHTDPFFFEFNGVPDKDSVNAIFIDNPGQLFVDVGFLNSRRYMFSTRFGDLDYYFSMADKPTDILETFVSMVGTSRLKPRYILGYHQGCYGYDHRGALEWVVDKYRQHQIPLDGLHVDVDIQNNYRIFTIDTKKFPDPYDMFHGLKAKGVKCSTNITPVISNEGQGYETYNQGLANNYFLLDRRHDPDNPESKKYQLYGGGNEYRPNSSYPYENPPGFNSGQPFIGAVYYGTDTEGNELGTRGHYSDLGRKEVRRWWGSQYQYLFDMGLEMVWQDMTTPAIRDVFGDMKGLPFRLYITNDFLCSSPPKQTEAIKVWNLYSYNLHKATYHGLNNLKGRENKRNFIIGRGSFTGSYRFAGLWTGDNSSDWDFLKMNIAQVLSLGMCGLAISGQDIGGFEASVNDDGKWASPELMIRWTAAGALLPWFRNHYVRKGRKEFQEPFMYEEWFNEYRDGNLPEPQDMYRMVLPICKHFIELRYRLLQLFYDAMFENTLSGMPICRPLFFNDPGDKSLYCDKEIFLDNEFFVGNDLLIAPVLDPQSNVNGYGKRDVYLPYGNNWYGFRDNKTPLGLAVEGGTTVRDYDANINLEGDHIGYILPIYVRAGAIIPTIELEQYVGELNTQGRPNPITLNIYPGEKGEYTMFLDDGVSRSSALEKSTAKGGDVEAKSEYRQTKIRHTYNTDDKARRITVERIHDNYTPKFETYFFVALLHDPDETKGKTGPLKNIRIGDQEIDSMTGGTPDEGSNRLNASGGNAWYYNENLNISFIKVFDDRQSIEISGEYC